MAGVGEPVGRSDIEKIVAEAIARTVPVAISQVMAAHGTGAGTTSTTGGTTQSPETPRVTQPRGGEILCHRKQGKHLQRAVGTNPEGILEVSN